MSYSSQVSWIQKKLMLGKAFLEKVVDKLNNVQSEERKHFFSYYGEMKETH